MKKTYQLELNGKKIEVQAYPMQRLLDVIREEAHLTGTKEGCGEGECGACSVIVNGDLVNSCLIPIEQMKNAKIQTVEGLAKENELHQLQKSFLKCGGAQCGICTPGMLMASYQLLKTNPKPNLEEVKEALSGNLCRCTGYMKIYDSVLDAAANSESGAKI